MRRIGELWAFVAGACAWAALAGGQEGAAPAQELRARRLVVADSEGRERIVLETDAQGRPAIRLLTEDGAPRMALALEPRHGFECASVQLFGSGSEPTVELAAGETRQHGGWQSLTFGHGGTQRVELGVHAVGGGLSLDFSGREGEASASIGLHGGLQPYARLTSPGPIEEAPHLPTEPAVLLESRDSSLGLRFAQDLEPVIVLRRAGAERTLGVE